MEKEYQELIELLNNPNEEITLNTFEKLIARDKSVLLILQKYLSTSQDKQQRLRIIKILDKSKEELSIPTLISLFNDEDWEIRKEASDVLAKFGAAASTYLTPLLQSENVKVRGRVLVILKKIKDASIIPLLIDLLTKEENETLKAEIIFNLGNFTDPAVINLFYSLITAPDPAMRRRVAIELSKIGNLESIPVLEPLLEDITEVYFLGTVRDAAKYAIKQILERSQQSI